jgi:hypothetical protein
VLGFALQDAACAAQVLALLTSSRRCLRFGCFLLGTGVSLGEVLHRATNQGSPALRHKGKTTP